MSKCIFTTGSVTYSLKANRILAENSIPCSTTKISARNNNRGCIYGIEFACSQKANVIRLLSGAGIDFEEYKE